MTRRTACLLATLGLCLLLTPVSLAQELAIAPDDAQGVYQPGQTIRWQVRVTGADVTEAAFTLKTGGLTELTKGKVALRDGHGQIEAKSDTPGWLLVDVSIQPAADKRVTALGGALVSPTKIQPALPRPDDFAAFWEGKLNELAAVPMNAKLESADSGKAAVDYCKITLDNIRGSRIRGQLARPKQGGKLPAMLIVQWAGVYPLQKGWVTDRAGEGWLTLAKVRHAAGYYDVVNFASQVQCPVLIGVGLIDTVCPPSGVYAAYNQLQGPKEIVVLPCGEHGEKQGSHGPYYARFDAWKRALGQGNAAPVQ